MARNPDRNTEYMRDYRRRRKLNGGQPLGPRQYVGTGVHTACDAEIAKLRHQVKMLQDENEMIRKMLPF